MFELKLEGRVPSKKNSRINIRAGRSFPSKKYTEWHEDASWQLFIQKKKVGIKKCTIEIEFYPPDKRRYDLTNKAESIMDLLVDNGILEDDNASVVQRVTLIAMPQTEFKGAKIKIYEM